MCASAPSYTSDVDQLKFDSSVLHTGAAASCFSLWYRDDTVRDAKRSSRLSRRFLRQNKGQQRLLQVVVREQLGPQQGKKAGKVDSLRYLYLSWLGHRLPVLMTRVQSLLEAHTTSESESCLCWAAEWFSIYAVSINFDFWTQNKQLQLETYVIVQNMHNMQNMCDNQEYAE